MAKPRSYAPMRRGRRTKLGWGLYFVMTCWARQSSFQGSPRAQGCGGSGLRASALPQDSSDAFRVGDAVMTASEEGSPLSAEGCGGGWEKASYGKRLSLCSRWQDGQASTSPGDLLGLASEK